MIFELEPLSLNKPRMELLSSYDTPPEDDPNDFIFSFKGLMTRSPYKEPKFPNYEDFPIVFKSKNNGVMNGKHSSISQLSDILRTTETGGITSTVKTAYEEFEELRLQLCGPNSLHRDTISSESSGLTGVQKEEIGLTKKVSSGSSTDSGKLKLKEIIMKSSDQKQGGNSISTNISSLAKEFSKKRKDNKGSRFDDSNEDNQPKNAFLCKSSFSFESNYQDTTKQESETLFENYESFEVLKAKGFFLNSDTLRNSLDNYQYEESLNSMVTLFKRKKRSSVCKQKNYIEKIQEENKMLKLTNVSKNYDFA